jgi:hypothetical protein
MSDTEVDALESEVEEGDGSTSELLQALVDPDTFYAKNTFRVVYQTNNFLLPQIRTLITDGQIINMRPEYQRRLRWNDKQKSKLIESLLLNIPIPSVFLFEGEAARYEVMDGQQRLTTIKEFMNNEFRLTSLGVLWPLNKMIYTECPPRIKRGLDRAVISAVVLLLESDAEIPSAALAGRHDIRRFIFERLNTGGTRLNAQEIRNAIYPGPFSDAIVDMARLKLFTKVWGIPEYIEVNPNDYYENPLRQRNTLYAKMTDCQIVLRFFALRDDSNIRGSMKEILDRCMENNQIMTAEQAEEAKGQFSERLEVANQIFENHPFELPSNPSGKVRLSISLYDAVMVAIDHLWDRRSQLLAESAAIRSEVTRLLQSPTSAYVITGHGNTARTIKERLERIKSAIATAARVQ